MKNAEELAKAIINTPPYSQRTGREWTDAIAKALQDAYRKGAEEMRARAAKTSQESWDRPGDVIYVSEVRHKEPYVTGKEWCDHVARRIRALPLTEGGAR